MSRQAIQVTHHHGTPESFHREIAEQRQRVEAMTQDLAIVRNQIKTAFSTVIGGIKTVLMGTINIRNAS